MVPYLTARDIFSKGHHLRRVCNLVTPRATREEKESKNRKKAVAKDKGNSKVRRVMKKEICKLCGKNEELRESHVIPEFFYQPVYEPNHVFYRLSSDSERPKQAHKGLYQKLFCDSCESLFQALEDYVAPVWFSKELKFRNESGISYMMGIDYSLFKLFQLSIIWRASVCSLSEFSNILIGAKHEGIIREMLLNRTPGNPDQYGCVIVHANDDEMQKIINGSMLFLPSFRHDGHRVYPLAYGALIWFFYISSHLNTCSFSDKFLSENGELPIVNDSKIAKRVLLLAANSLRGVKMPIENSISG
jgi:hypothetical protein